MTLEEYEAVLAEKRAGLNKTTAPAFKADKAQFKGMKAHEKVRRAALWHAALFYVVMYMSRSGRCVHPVLGVPGVPGAGWGSGDRGGSTANPHEELRCARC